MAGHPVKHWREAHKTGCCATHTFIRLDPRLRGDDEILT
jgi:hypothetical protein